MSTIVPFHAPWFQFWLSVLMNALLIQLHMYHPSYVPIITWFVLIGACLQEDYVTIRKIII